MRLSAAEAADSLQTGTCLISIPPSRAHSLLFSRLLPTRPPAPRALSFESPFSRAVSTAWETSADFVYERATARVLCL